MYVHGLRLVVKLVFPRGCIGLVNACDIDWGTSLSL